MSLQHDPFAPGVQTTAARGLDLLSGGKHVMPIKAGCRFTPRTAIPGPHRQIRRVQG